MSSFSKNLESSILELNSHQKPKRGTPLYTRTVNRLLGKYLAALAFELRMSPTQLTILSALLTFCSFLGLIIFPTNVYFTAFFTIILLLAYALDSADGQLARLKQNGTAAGEWLDHTTDALKQVFFHAAILLILFAQGEITLFMLLIPLCFIAVQLTVFTSNLLKEKLFKIYTLSVNSQPDLSVNPPDSVSLLKDILFFCTDYGILCMLFFFLSFSNIFWCLYVFFFLANSFTGTLMLCSSYKRLLALT